MRRHIPKTRPRQGKKPCWHRKSPTIWNGCGPGVGPTLKHTWKGKICPGPSCGGLIWPAPICARSIFPCRPAGRRAPGIRSPRRQYVGGGYQRGRSHKRQYAPGRPEFFPTRQRQLAGTDLAGASLLGAQLNGTDFVGVNLLDADLDGADLSGAKGLNQKQLDKARMGPETVLPPGFRVRED